ncbi:hypothetical protein EBR96_02620 [bacterium]|nr:hypothetical protein [bacterium]
MYKSIAVPKLTDEVISTATIAARGIPRPTYPRFYAQPRRADGCNRIIQHFGVGLLSLGACAVFQQDVTSEVGKTALWAVTVLGGQALTLGYHIAKNVRATNSLENWAHTIRSQMTSLSDATPIPKSTTYPCIFAPPQQHSYADIVQPTEALAVAAIKDRPYLPDVAALPFSERVAEFKLVISPDSSSDSGSQASIALSLMHKPETNRQSSGVSETQPIFLDTTIRDVQEWYNVTAGPETAKVIAFAVRGDSRTWDRVDRVGGFFPKYNPTLTESRPVDPEWHQQEYFEQTISDMGESHTSRTEAKEPLISTTRSIQNARYFAQKASGSCVYLTLTRFGIDVERWKEAKYSDVHEKVTKYTSEQEIAAAGIIPREDILACYDFRTNTLQIQIGLIADTEHTEVDPIIADFLRGVVLEHEVLTVDAAAEILATMKSQVAGLVLTM